MHERAREDRASRRIQKRGRILKRRCPRLHPRGIRRVSVVIKPAQCRAPKRRITHKRDCPGKKGARDRFRIRTNEARAKYIARRDRRDDERVYDREKNIFIMYERAVKKCEFFAAEKIDTCDERRK